MNEKIIPNIMDISYIKKVLTIALEDLKKNDQFLLDHDVNEPSISHMPAIYLSPHFPGFDVDCEYNSNVEADHPERKYIVLLKDRAKALVRLRKDEEEDELIYRRVFPDIIVHRRGKTALKITY